MAEAINYAAKVNDQEISRGQFENAFNSERNRMQQQLGDQYSELAANEGYMKTLRQQGAESSDRRGAVGSVRS
ncbi:peptidyl-prolyl cis-trans isomerase D [Escherichia coli]|uniref:Peptidyl-prolyl cis-trans isomerase D n=1 Tax=Escherichia coli TaxID=562 RepID=A0A2X3M3I2_ECOLX|nr:peptidyl-prolyl cis-trans isomerase D [Escherichia coli]